MVKESHRRASSSSEDEDYQRHRHKRHRSPERARKKHKKHHHGSRSESPIGYLGKLKREADNSPELKLKIKREPKSSESDASSSDSERRHRVNKVKRQRSTEHDSEHRGSHRRHGHGHHITVKQEPDSEEEMRQQRAERRRNDQRRRETHQQRREHLSEHDRYGRRENQENSETAAAAEQSKDQPDFKLSGKLTEDTNTYKGVVIKYNEPPEARKPKKRWRLYPFKNDEALKPFHMHRQSAYLFGRDRLIADIPIDHPSCSKQHAVFQYRMVPYEKDDGRKAYKIAPYIIDLESANGTFVNNKKIEPRRYVELMEKDVVKFGFSSREYVLLHDKSSTAEVESDLSS